MTPPRRPLVAKFFFAKFFLAKFLAVSAFILPLAIAAPSTRAQDYDRPPGSIGNDRGFGTDTPDARADAPDPAGLAVRIGRLEERVREMTGQIEELQNDNRKLVEQLQKFESDVDSRSAGTRQKRGDAAPALAPAHAETDAPKPPPRQARDDAFDPDAAPNAPGQPKPLGSTASAAADQPDANAPMDLSGDKLRSADPAPDTPAPALRTPAATPRPMTSRPMTSRPMTSRSTAPDTEVADATPETPRAAYDTALGLYRDKQYDAAEKGFSAFIQKNPKNRLVADATYFLGESYAQRGRSREAAEQYLKISTDFPNSTRAPDAMLHLGMSLKALGAKEQACATFSEVSRKYPNAPAYVRGGAEREAKRSQC